MWLCLLVSILIILVLWYKLSHFNLLDSFGQLFRTLTDQSITKYGIVKKNEHDEFTIAFYVFLIPWTLCANILTKSFLSILLGIYSTQKSYPLVQSLEDICDNKQLFVGNWIVLNESQLLDENCLKSIRNRRITKDPYPKVVDINEYVDKEPVQMTDPYILADILRGKLVFLLPTRKVEEVLSLKNKDNFIVAKNKYNQVYRINSLDKNFKFKSQIFKR